MNLTEHDLQQLDEEYISSLSYEQLLALSVKMLLDLKESHERLNLNPSNSSLPPSTRAPWEQDETGKEQDDGQCTINQVAKGELEQTEVSVSDQAPEGNTHADENTKKANQKRPGKVAGTQGYGRTQKLPINAEQVHSPETCASCSAHLDDKSLPRRTYAAHYEIDLIHPGDGDTGLEVFQTKHIYQDCQCHCGHWTREQPGCCQDEGTWTVQLTERHLAGPMLVSFICALTLRMRLSRSRIKEFLRDWLGLELGVATINQCIHEAGRAVEPIVKNEILNAVREAEQLYADETAWKEHGKLLWLWVFTSATVTLFVVGKRDREMVLQVLTASFEHWLMTDGYGVYRDYPWRLRCLAHIYRKARGLEQSLDRQVADFGKHVLHVIDIIIDTVYQARGSPADISLREKHAELLNNLLDACVGHANSKHKKASALARELLNDWDTFWVVLEHPELPLTNNEAERALRHWVIARRISYGTRTAQGSVVFAYLASVIETCRKRAASPWEYLAEVLRQRRKNLPAPPLPLPAIAPVGS